MEPWAWSIILLLIGLVIFVLEMFIPSGGVLGVLSTLAIIASLVLAFMAGLKFGLVMLLITSILLPAIFIAGLHYWPKTPFGRRILIKPPHGDDFLPDNDQHRLLQSLIGKTGVAKSKMLPSGIISVEGRTFDAFTDSTPVEPGQTVQVIAVKMNRLEVRLLENVPHEQARGKPANADDILSRPIESLGLEDPLA